MPFTASVPTLDVTVPVFDPKGGGARSHLEWARVIARDVRARFGFGSGSQEERDLEQTAYAELLRKLAAFDTARVPVGGNAHMLFRGWVKLSIATACKREALRLRNGGTYHTTRTPPAPLAELPEDLAEQPVSTAVEVGDVRCRFYDTGLYVESVPDLHAWAVAVGELDTQRERSLWLLGDLTAYGLDRFGSDAWDQLGALGYSSTSVRQAGRVCQKFPAETRIPALKFGHHRVVMKLPIERALALLRRAKRERLSVSALQAFVDAQEDEGLALLTPSERARLPAVAERYGLTAELALAFLTELRGGRAA